MQNQVWFSGNNSWLVNYEFIEGIIHPIMKILKSGHYYVCKMSNVIGFWIDNHVFPGIIINSML